MNDIATPDPEVVEEDPNDNIVCFYKKDYYIGLIGYLLCAFMLGGIGGLFLCDHVRNKQREARLANELEEETATEIYHTQDIDEDGWTITTSTELPIEIFKRHQLDCAMYGKVITNRHRAVMHDTGMDDEINNHFRKQGIEYVSEDGHYNWIKKNPTTITHNVDPPKSNNNQSGRAWWTSRDRSGVTNVVHRPRYSNNPDVEREMIKKQLEGIKEELRLKREKEAQK